MALPKNMPVVERSKTDYVKLVEVTEDDTIEFSSVPKTTFGFPPNDFKNILQLTFLYFLQGIPLGLSASIPFLLTEKNISYSDQGLFSLSVWPFSLKLLWAPIVDSLYLSSFGRRKFWLVPVQYAIGALMLIFSYFIDEWFGPLGGSVKMVQLTVAFTSLNFLAATQDIVVDGWALTILDRANLGWASTCNTVGQTMGYFTGFMVFITLQSPDFANYWFRTVYEPTGLVTFSGFLQCWAIVYIGSTTLIALFKNERSVHLTEEKFENDSNDVPPHLSLFQTYKMLFQIFKLPAVLSYILIIFSIKVSFAATDSLTGLKLLERGVSKEKMSMLGVFAIPVQIILPLAISRSLSGTTPLNFLLRTLIPRNILAIAFAFFVHYSPMFMLFDDNYGGKPYYPFYYYCIAVMLFACHQIMACSLFVCVIAFFASISDESIGGTYMTLMNTMTNLAGSLPSTASIYMVDVLSVGTCRYGSVATNQTCSNNKQCQSSVHMEKMGNCNLVIDGYYLLVTAGVVFGLLTCTWVQKKARNLQALSIESWRVHSNCD